MNAPTRPALRYHGGKWKLAKWLLTFFPRHHIYVESFGGAASVLLQKPRSYGEVYNDLDDGVVNVFRVLRDPTTAAELCRRINLTPFAREEFKAAYGDPVDEIDAAHKMIIRSFMGFGSASMTRMHITGFRSNSNRSGTNPSQDWANWPRQIEAFTERLRGVVIENRPAHEVMLQHDAATTLHYVDPPYVPTTRSSLKGKNGARGHFYRHDMTEADHATLAESLHRLRGMVIVSGYPCDLYDRELYADWERHERRHMADGARPRIEVLWINPACSAALRAGQSQMTFVACS